MDVPKTIKKIIIDYYGKILVDFVDEKKMLEYIATTDIYYRDLYYIEWFKFRYPKLVITAEDVYRKDPESKELDWGTISSCGNFIHIIESIYDKDPNDKRIHWPNLHFNICSANIMEKEHKSNPNSERLLYEYLTCYPRYVYFIKQFRKYGAAVDWFKISHYDQPEIVELILEEYNRSINKMYTRISFSGICTNSNDKIVDIVIKEFNKRNQFIIFNIDKLCANTNPRIINLLIEEYKKGSKIVDEFDWNVLSENINGIPLLDLKIKNDGWRCNEYYHRLIGNKNCSQIIKDNIYNYANTREWREICFQPHLIDLVNRKIREHGIGIWLNWDSLSQNSAAIHLLRKYPEKIKYKFIKNNENIFYKDYTILDF